MKVIKILFLVFFATNFLHASSLHVRLLEPFLGIKYRQYGTTNEDERYTLFINQDKIYESAGLDDKGFVFSAYKRLFGKSMEISEVFVPNKNNENEIYKNNFSLNLALNLALNHQNRFLNSSFCEFYKRDFSFDIYNIRRWSRVFERMNKENIYLAIFSKTIRNKEVYSHIGIIIKDDNKNIFLYQSTPKYGVHKIWMDFDKKMSIFAKDIDSLPLKVLILELQL